MCLQDRGTKLRKSTSRTFPQVSATGLPVQVAAVCYRVRGSSLEFLLVNTSAGKWTFPKGRIVPGLSGSESAALEALEEAGAEGRIEEQHFASYVDSKRALSHDNRSREILIAAYLLEVHNAGAPEEGDRNPTWFTTTEAQERLAEQREPKYAGQLATVVDAAVERVVAAQLRLWLREPEGSGLLLHN
jgi:8-oxo-dGTP pyrophosphatase MutT (NUDIX family)